MHDLGNLGGGAMLRLIDVERALALPIADDAIRGNVGLDISDPVFGSLALDLSLESELRVRQARRFRHRLALDVDRLAQIYSGSVPARSLLRDGLIEGSARAADLLDRAFAGPPVFLSPLNAF